MKFGAKVELNNFGNAQTLIRAFFEEFNPESSITIKGNEANVEIFFSGEPPMKILDAICKASVVEFNFENSSIEEHSEAEADEKSNKTEPKEPDEKRKAERTRKVEIVDLPELEEIAKKSKSFEHFVISVAEWLKMEKKFKLFVNLVIAATEVENVTWKSLGDALREKGMSFTMSERNAIVNHVSSKLSNYHVKMIPLLNTIRQYKDYCFEPEFLIPELKKILGTVDKSWPIEERVKDVLYEMGFADKTAEEQDTIFEIVNTAVRMRDMDIDNIFQKSNIPAESATKARMIFSQFINDFITKYAPGKQVKVIDFLIQLQKSLMFKSEISAD